ncbi:FAD-dependent oxidoreductase [Candidatus Kuenenia sp.]|uniref:FAD-dependent oxidoreductase n=1 Tax=Candidatus Kuenenia sp. TaxID=2499824 RepID=UPI00321FDB97
MKTERVKIAKRSDLKKGESKTISLDDKSIILLNHKGTYYALETNCSHHNAGLVKGIVSDKSIICPLHHAKFSLEGGQLEEPPGLDGIFRYDVEIEGEDIYVNLPETQTRENSFPNVTAKHSPSNSSHYAIVGAGAAGAAAAETLRKNGFDGKITLITKENQLPYDRTILSKQYLQNKKTLRRIPYRNEDFYRKLKIDLLLGKNAEFVNTEKKVIEFYDDQIKYDKLLIAPGSSPICPDLPGSTLKNIFTLRTLEDANTIFEAAEKSKKLVIVGASFIGLECTAILIEKGIEVIVVEMEAVPFEAVLGYELGKIIQGLHEDKGVTFRLDTKVKAFKGDNEVKKVELDDSTEIDADMVILGMGVSPDTNILAKSYLDNNSSVKVDEYMRMKNADGTLFAAGDIVSFDYKYTGENIRIAHWRMAEQQGIVAALNMMSPGYTFDKIPFFWTEQYDFHLSYLGHAQNWDETIINGDLSHAFLMYYLKNNQLHAVAGKDRLRELCIIEECIRLHMLPPVEKIKKGEVDWESIYKNHLM